MATGQLEYSVEQACEGLENAPRHRQVIEIGLKVTGQDLSETGWLKVFRQFFALMKEGDANVMILRKRPQSKRNTITRIEEIPTTQKELEQDYVFDVSIIEEGTRLKLRMMTASTVSFARLFKSRNANDVYNKLLERDWYVKSTSLTTQGPRKTMGWLKGLHPVLTNHDNLLTEIKGLLSDISPHIEIYLKNEKKYYKQDAEEETVQKVEARIICLSAPKDISDQMMAIMGKRIRQLKEGKTTKNHSTLLNSQFIPNSKKISLQSQIVHLREHVEECQRYNEPIQIYNCRTIDKEFSYPDELASYTTQKSRVGKTTTIRNILLKLKLVDEEKKKKIPIVHLIEQRDEQRYAILISKDLMSMEDARKTLFEIVTILRREVEGWPVVCETRGGLRIDGEENIDGNEDEKYIEELQVEDMKLIPITNREYRNRYENRGRTSNRGRGRGSLQRDRKWTNRGTQGMNKDEETWNSEEKQGEKMSYPSYKNAVIPANGRQNAQAEIVRNDVLVQGGKIAEATKGTITITNERGEIELPGTIERYLDNKISMAVNSAIHKVNEDNRRQNMEIMEKVENTENKIEQTTKRMEDIKIAQETTDNNIREYEKTINDNKQAIKTMEGAVQEIQEANNIMNIVEIQNQVRQESEATRNMIREMMQMMSKKDNQQDTNQTKGEVGKTMISQENTQAAQHEKAYQHDQQQQEYNDIISNNTTKEPTVATTQETVSTMTRQEDEYEEESVDEFNMKSIGPEDLIECLETTPQRIQKSSTSTPQSKSRQTKQITPSKRSKYDRSSDEESDEDTVSMPKVQRITGPTKSNEKLEIQNNIKITHIIKTKDNNGKIQNTNNTNNNSSKSPETKGKKPSKTTTGINTYNTRSSAQKPTRVGKPKVGDNPSKEPHYTPRTKKGGSRWGENP